MRPTTPIVPSRELEVTNFAKEQPEYNPLPAYRAPNGVVLSRWKLTWRERWRMLWNGYFYLEVWTFNKLLQPVRLSLDPPDFE